MKDKQVNIDEYDYKNIQQRRDINFIYTGDNRLS